MISLMLGQKEQEYSIESLANYFFSSSLANTKFGQPAWDSWIMQVSVCQG